MWRWLSGIPRTVRQHLHGPRASASGVCKEEELDEAKKCAETTCQQRFHVQHLRCFTSVGTGSHHGSNDNRHNEGAGPDKEKGHRHAPNFWSLFCGPGSFDALGVGTAIVVGVHVTKYHTCLEKRKKKEKPKNSHCIVYRIICALPVFFPVKKSIIGTEDKCDSSTYVPQLQHDSLLPDVDLNSVVSEQDQNKVFPSLDHQKISFDVQESQDEDLDNDETVEKKDTDKEDDTTSRKVLEPLDTVMREFETVCRTYTSIGHNISGLKTAAIGRMTEAANHWAEASSYGYGKASYNVGLCYETGKGVKKNIGQAIKYYQRAVKENHSQATYNLALIYLGGEGLVANHDKLGMELMEKAADLGLPEAQLFLGIYYTEEEHVCYEKAASYFQAAASQDDIDALYLLGICYEHGEGVDENPCRAADLYSQAANQGHDGAIYNLAVFHEYGLGGLPVDKVTAMELYKKAAELGNANAIERLEGSEQTPHMWKEQYMYDFIEEPKLQSCSPVVKEEPQPHIKEDKPVTHLSLSHSTPSLTDYVRGHLDDIDLKIDSHHTVKHEMSLLKKLAEEIPPVRELLWLPQYGSPKRMSPPAEKKNVFFSVGEIDFELQTDDENLLENNVMIETQFSSRLNKNHTMPNFQVLSCS